MLYKYTREKQMVLSSLEDAIERMQDWPTNDLFIFIDAFGLILKSHNVIHEYLKIKVQI